MVTGAHFYPVPRDEMTTSGLLWFFLLALLIPAQMRALAQECSDETMKRCRKNILDSLNTNGYSDRNSVNDQCRTIRENFDCLLWQTSMCLDKEDQDANRDSILKSWRYLGIYCESDGIWYTKPCYQRDDVKRCEGLLPSRGYSTDTASCQSYVNFRSCATSAIQSHCSISDQRLLGTYLMEKGQQRAWNCPRSYNNRISNTNPASAPLAADVDTRYTSMTDTSYGYCSDESRYALQDCRTYFYATLKEAQTHNDSDMKNHKTCCALVNYEDCVVTTLDDRCGDRGRTEGRNIVSDMKSRYPYYSCSDHTKNECSSAALLKATIFVNVLLILISVLIYKRD